MTPFFNLLVASLTVYAVTTVITTSHVAKGARRLFRELAWECTPEWMGKNMVKWFTTEADQEMVIAEDEQETDYTLEREVRGFSFIECPLCVGFWVALPVCFVLDVPVSQYLAVYGASWFLHKIER